MSLLPRDTPGDFDRLPPAGRSDCLGYYWRPRGRHPGRLDRIYVYRSFTGRIWEAPERSVDDGSLG